MEDLIRNGGERPVILAGDLVRFEHRMSSASRWRESELYFVVAGETDNTDIAKYHMIGLTKENVYVDRVTQIWRQNSANSYELIYQRDVSNNENLIGEYSRYRAKFDSRYKEKQEF